MDVTSVQRKSPVILELLQTPKHINKRLPEPAVHEAIRDWVATARRVCQKLKETDARVSEVIVNDRRIKKDQRVDRVERRPADEELEHHGKEHLDDALLIEEAPLRVGATQARAGLSLAAR